MTLSVTPTNLNIELEHICFDAYGESVEKLLSIAKRLDDLVSSLDHPEIMQLWFIQEELFQARIKISLTQKDPTALTKYLDKRMNAILECQKIGSISLKPGKQLTKEDILNFHSIVKLSSQNKIESQYRANDVWLGNNKGSAYMIGMAPEYIESQMNSILDILNSGPSPKILNIAIFYMAFLSIHPFSDANGRTARAITSLLFYNKSILKNPVFNLSSALEKYQFELIKLSHKVLTNSEWNSYLRFFMEISTKALEQHMEIATHILVVESKVKKLVSKENGFPKMAKLFEQLFLHLKISRSALRDNLKMSIIEFQKLILRAQKDSLLLIEGEMIIFDPISRLVLDQDWGAKIETHNRLEIPPGLIPRDYDPFEMTADVSPNHVY